MLFDGFSKLLHIGRHGWTQHAPPDRGSAQAALMINRLASLARCRVMSPAAGRLFPWVGLTLESRERRWILHDGLIDVIASAAHLR